MTPPDPYPEARGRAPRMLRHPMHGGLVLGLAVASMSCAASQLPPIAELVTSDRGLEVRTVSEGERVLLIERRDDRELVCSPRESDEGLSFSTGFQLSLPTGGSSVGLGDQAGEKATSIGLPSAAVQLARELLFRACELSINLDASPEDTLKIYDRFLAALERMAPALQTAATSKSSGSESSSSED